MVRIRVTKHLIYSKEKLLTHGDRTTLKNFWLYPSLTYSILTLLLTKFVIDTLVASFFLLSQAHRHPSQCVCSLHLPDFNIFSKETVTKWCDKVMYTPPPLHTHLDPPSSLIFRRTNILILRLARPRNSKGVFEYPLASFPQGFFFTLFSVVLFLLLEFKKNESKTS